MPHIAGPQSPSPPDTTPPQEISPVAFWTAAAHAAENERPEPYVRDPWAAAFLDAAGFRGGPPGQGLLQRLLPDWAVVRTRFFDEHLMTAARSGCRQVVLLGAGLDARAHRLDWPTGVQVFEVENPALLDFKERVLDGHQPSCGRRSVVATDPAGPWGGELIAAGFDPRRPTAWLAETLLYHLQPETVHSIVATATELSAPGSTFAAECVNAQAVPSSFVAPFLEALASTGFGWHWQVAEPERWWARHGWDVQAADLYTLPYVIQRLSPYLPILAAGAAKCVFLTSGTLRDRSGG